MRVKIVDEGRHYQIESSSGGHWYNVMYQGSGDADPECVALWECDCPAGQHGKPCKHIDLIGALTAWEPEYGVAGVIGAGWITGVELVED